MKLKNILLILSIILLAACNKPTLVNEKVLSYPTQTRSGTKYIQDEKDLSRIAWWKKLNDPLLTKLITQALACNNNIQSANATILQAQAQLRSAQFAWIPTLDGSARGFTVRTWDTHATPQGSLATTPIFSNLSHLKFHGYDAGFVPNYSVNILNNIYNVKSAKASLAIKEAQAQSTKLSIISQMAGAYFMLLSQQAQLKLEKILIRDLKSLQRLEYIRYKSGANDIERVTTLDQDIAQEETKVPQIENVIAQNENAIHLLLNQNPGPIPTYRHLLAIKTEHLIPENLPSSVLRNRPDIIIALNDVIMANAQFGIAFSAFFPTISLTGMLGKASIDLSHLLKLSTAFWIAQAAISTKLFDASAYQDIKAAKAQYCSTYFNYLQTLRASFADVDNNLTNEQKTRIAYLQTKKGYAAAKKTYAIALSQYKAGGKDYRDVLNAKLTVDRYALTLVQEKAQLLDSIVQVYTAVAGGYAA